MSPNIPPREGSGMDPDSPQEPPKDKLDELLNELKGVYDYEVSEYRRCLNIVTKDLGHILAQESIRHLPIASRVKSWDSINGTARRRQKDRLTAQTIQRKMMEQNENWEQNFERYRMSKSELGYFRDRDELEHVFHDMLGARIVLYFPSDTKNVLRLLEDAGYEKAKEPKRMGGLADVKRLRKLHAKWLNASTSKAPADDLDLDGLERQFSGYGAFHLAVKLPERLQPRDLGPEAVEIWERRVVEIQVGTVIMHAWAEVEHDITYKTHGREVTQDEKGLLDMLNGLAIASEVGMRRFRSPPSSPSPIAESDEELHSWLHQLYITKKRSTPVKWVDLDQLWDFLVRGGSNRRDAFQPLAETAWQTLLNSEDKEGFDLDHALPYIIMHGHVPLHVIQEGPTCRRRAPSEIASGPDRGEELGEGDKKGETSCVCTSYDGSGGLVRIRILEPQGWTVTPFNGHTNDWSSWYTALCGVGYGPGLLDAGRPITDIKGPSDGKPDSLDHRTWFVARLHGVFSCPGLEYRFEVTRLCDPCIREGHYAPGSNANNECGDTNLTRPEVRDVILEPLEATGNGRFYRVLADNVEIHEAARFWVYNGYPNSHLLTILGRLGVNARYA
ncbi:hypothetical protein DL764_006063 [Monosporascus ibericus]|uniref:RelA/SpoT domain-containing protein n=1 Tax=Monosporascus ibericus TaxID=155417 RepID=A0A4Q4T5Z6_9PEZI|nr:hypothetical protein DL764_006063 [Monosporascus ibericus]